MYFVYLLIYINEYNSFRFCHVQYTISTQLALHNHFIIVSSDGDGVLSPHTDTIIIPLLTDTDTKNLLAMVFLLLTLYII